MNTHEDMLRKIRALLAKAEGGTTPEEAELLRDKADELMTKYAIELWQLEQANADATQRTKPERRDVSIDWWYNYRTSYEVRAALWQIFHSVARHCRCIIVVDHSSYVDKTVPVVGMPADLTYFDMLFTHLYVQMAAEMDPHPKPGEELVEALARMKEAGLKWEECHRRLRASGLVPDEPWDKKVASKMNFAGKYTRYCREHGRERTYVAPSIYQRSFVEGFERELRKRLHHQAEQQGQNTGSMAIALRDISVVVREAMWDMFEDMRPHPEGCDCDVHHRCNKPNCMRPNCKAARSKRMPARREMVTVDYGVIARGREAGSRVTILSDAPGVGHKKELS